MRILGRIAGARSAEQSGIRLLAATSNNEQEVNEDELENDRCGLLWPCSQGAPEKAAELLRSLSVVDKICNIIRVEGD